MPEPIYLQGKCKWAALHQPDTRWGDPRWKITLYPNPPSLDIIKGLLDQGLMNELKKDDDGYYLNISRPVSRRFGPGPEQPLTPPIVLGEDGTPFYGAIGNGSDVTIKCEVYKFSPRGAKDAPKKPAIRLNTVKVDSLVPWEKKEDFRPDQIKQIGKIEEQPPQTWSF